MRTLYGFIGLSIGVAISAQMRCFAQQTPAHLQKEGTTLAVTNVPSEHLSRVADEQNKMLQKQLPWMAISKTNSPFARAVGYITSEMAGHKPEKLPTGLTQADISNAYYHMFIEPQLARVEQHTVQSEPIRFYGKVTDHQDQPVSSMRVHLIWTDTSTNGSSEADILTDAQGLFRLTRSKGRLLQVWLKNDNYYFPKTNQVNFDYARGYAADPNNPEVFRVVKKGPGTDLITSRYGISPDFKVAVSKDGTPIQVDLLRRNAGGGGQLEIQNWIQTDPETHRTSSWRLRLAISDGGFIANEDEFPFMAPENGYQTELNFPSQVSAVPHFGISQQSYYIAFGQPRRYGRIEISASATTGNVMLQYAINPDGSRYLEPK